MPAKKKDIIERTQCLKPLLIFLKPILWEIYNFVAQIKATLANYFFGAKKIGIPSKKISSVNINALSEEVLNDSKPQDLNDKTISRLMLLECLSNDALRELRLTDYTPEHILERTLEYNKKQLFAAAADGNEAFTESLYSHISAFQFAMYIEQSLDVRTERYNGKTGDNDFEVVYSFISNPKHGITKSRNAQLNVMVHFFDPDKKISFKELKEVCQNTQTQITDRIKRGASKLTRREILTFIYNQILSYYNQPAVQPLVQQNVFTQGYAIQTALEEETEPNVEHREFNRSSLRRSPVQF